MSWRWVIAWMCVTVCCYAQPIPVKYPLTSHAHQLLNDLPRNTEALVQWPLDDELWLHHDAAHLLAVEIDSNRVKNWAHLFDTLDREFQGYAIYRLYKPYYLIIMSRGGVIPWPKHPVWAARFVADQSLLMRLFALHQVAVRHINLDHVGRTLPLHLLYPELRHNLMSVWHPPTVGPSHDWQRLNLAVSLASPALLLSSATELIGPYWQRYSVVHQQYVLGMAMIANAMVHQYASCLLLWDKYSPDIYTKHRPNIDMLLLRNYCIHQSAAASMEKPVIKHRGLTITQTGLHKRVA